MKRLLKNPAIALVGAGIGAASVLILTGNLGSGSSVAAPTGGIPPARELVVRLEQPLLRVEGEVRVVLAGAGLLEGVATALQKESSPVPSRLLPAELIEEYVEVVEGPETFRRSKPDGSYLFRGEQIQDSEGAWVRHGRWQAWHANGERDEEGAYRRGNEDGPWEWWYENGQQMARGHFDKGRRVGPWTFWYEEGELMMTGSYDEQGAAIRTWIYYHPNGRKASEGEMISDHPEGRWTAWDENGSVNLERSGVYKRGERINP